MFVVSVALRSCARQPTRLLTLATSVAACCRGEPRILLRVSTPATLLRTTSSELFIDGAAGSLTTSRRFGSGVAQKSSAGRGRGRERGRERGNAATRITAATSAVDAQRAAHAEKDDKGGEPFLHRAGEDDDNGEDETALVSPMTKRIGRGGSNRRGGLMGEDDNAEDELEGVETPTEDPTAPAHDEDDAEVSRRYRHHGGEDEEDETRVDGAEETENTKGAVANLALEGKDDEPGRKRSASAAARRRAGQGNAGEDGDAEEDEEDTATSSTSNAVGGETTALDTSPHDEEVANKYLSVAFPDLAAEYTAAGPQSNKVPVEEVRIDSAEVAAWRCPVCAKTWSCGVFVRCILKNGCPHCAAEHRTTMSTVRPDLLQLWDYNRNNPFLKPEEIAADSREVAYWTCPTCRETYTARVRDRVQDKTQCPSCALLRSTSADAAGSAASALQLEWHPLKNGDLRIDQLAPTDRKTKVWWLCGSCGHEWEASLGTRLSHSPRSRGRNCPACHGKATAEIL